MQSQPDNRPAIDRERRVLQALCAGDRKVLESAVGLLAVYRWREAVHQIIFTCLSSFSASGHVSLRERLAACATRKGFPDVDWEEFFPPDPISGGESEERLQQLLDLDSAGFQGQ